MNNINHLLTISKNFRYHIVAYFCLDTVRYEWDDDKRIKNLLKHGVDFTEVEGFQWQTAKVIADKKPDYGEKRYVATGFINDRLHVMAFAIPSGTIRIISLRKANKREVKNYEETSDR